MSLQLVPLALPPASARRLESARRPAPPAELFSNMRCPALIAGAVVPSASCGVPKLAPGDGDVARPQVLHAYLRFTMMTAACRKADIFRAIFSRLEMHFSMCVWHLLVYSR